MVQGKKADLIDRLVKNDNGVQITDYESLTHTELKTLCDNRKIISVRKKDIMIKSLVENDRKCNDDGDNSNNTNYSDLSYLKLKKLCAGRDMCSTGKKIVLIGRLEKDDEKYTTKEGEIIVHVKHFVSGSFRSLTVSKDMLSEEFANMVSEALDCRIVRVCI